MKDRSIFIFLLVMSLASTAQDQLLVKSKGRVVVTEVSNTAEKVITETCSLDLLGFSISKDSLHIYSGENGSLRHEVFPFSGLSRAKVASAPTTSNQMSLYHPTKGDSLAVFQWESISLTNLRGQQIKCFRDSTLLWEKQFRMINYGPFTSTGVGFCCPVMANDKTFILFTIYRTNLWGAKRKPRIIEVEMSSGKQRVVSRRSDQASLSSDDHYILFEKHWKWHHKFGIYDRITEKTIFYDNWDKAFWIQ